MNAIDHAQNRWEVNTQEQKQGAFYVSDNCEQFLTKRFKLSLALIYKNKWCNYQSALCWF